MKKKLLWLLLAACVVIFPLTAKETKAETEGDWEFSYYNPGVSVDAYNGTDENVVVPEKLGGEDVKVIDGRAFSENENVKTVKLPSSVTYIGEWAFSGCTSLTEITIPSSVTYIGENTFSGCTSLTEVTIPSSITSIGMWAFSRCTSLTEITIPSSVTEIENGAFSRCTSLSKITIPSSVLYIGKEAFAGTKWLSDKQNENPYVVINEILIDVSKAGTYLNIPDTVKKIRCDIPENVVNVTLSSSTNKIHSYMFADCKSLKKITIPSSVTYIGDNAFSGCASLTEITIPSSVTDIGGYAFYLCTSLTKITIPSSVTDIGDGAFSMCMSLTEITIPSSVTYIGYKAFSRCESLTEITVPSSVTYIGQEAFAETKWLSDKQNENPYVVINGILIDVSKAGTNLNIPDTVKEISCDIPKNVVSVTMPSSITQIYSYMFADCILLKKITIPSSITSIGDGAFSGCTSLETIEIPETVDLMKISYFSGTKWLENNLVDGKYLVVNNVLYDTQNLDDDIVIPEGVKKVKTVFPDSMHSISFPASMEEIEPLHNSNIYEVIVNSENKNYSSYDGCLYSKDKKTLYWCPRLKESVSVYPETTQIADHAFSYCDKLKSVDIKKVTQLEWATFYNCSELTTITVPDNFEGMKDFVFERCNKFTTIKLSGNSGKDVIYKGCLYNKDKTKLIMVPVAKTDFKIEDSVVEIGYGAVAFNMTQDIVTIPKKVNTIRGVAFAGSKINLRFIYERPENVEATSFSSRGDLYFVPSSKWAEYIECCDGGYDTGNWIYIYEAGVQWGDGFRYNEVFQSYQTRLIFDGLFIARDGNLYYFKDGMLDKTFNGTASYDGISYTVKAGKAVGLASIPQPSSASNITSGIQLKWSKVTDATGYILYRKTGSGSWSRIADIKNGSTVSYIDKTAKSGTTYTYTIRAYSGKYMSDWKTTKTIKRLADPTVSATSNITAGVQVKWSKVTGATGYIVYRKTGKGSWSRVADIKSGSTVSYTDKTAKSGTTYTYTVRAYSGSTMGDWSSTKTVKRLADPTVSSASNITAGVQVKWAKTAGATGYVVYRKTGTGSWSRIATIKSGSTTSYTDKSAKSGTNYSYTVRACNGSTMSDWHNYKTVKRLSNPAVTSASKTSNGINVKWSKVTGATGYVVYRKTAKGSWSRIANIKSGSTTSYTDTKASRGVTYTYTVRAYNGSTMSSFNSTKSAKR